jgi:hypothetical protein
MPDHNVDHPINGVLHTQQVMKQLRSEMIDGEAANALAQRMFADWPAGPRYFSIHMPLLGALTKPYTCGLLTTQRIELRAEDDMLLQDRRVPLHGRITVSQAPPATGIPEPPPLVVKVSVPNTGDLRVTETEEASQGATATQWTVNFATAAAIPRFSLQPIAPPAGDATARQAYCKLLAEICHAFGRNRKTRNYVRQVLRAYEDDIRPPGWPPAGLPEPSGDEVFHGGREPWSYVARWHLQDFFNGLQDISFTGPGPHPPIRPAEAMVLWIMEGKIALQAHNLLTTSGRPELDIADLPFPGDAYQFPAADIDAASATQIKTIMRVLTFYQHWGLDDFNSHSGGVDNPPLLDGPIATAVTQHNTRLNQGLTRIDSANVTHPSADTITDSIRTRKVGGRHKIRVRRSFIENLAWLQYSEYLRRMTLLPANLPTVIVGQAREDVWNYPAFSYMAYNGGITTTPNGPINPNKPVFQRWQEATDAIADPACSATKQQDALRCWRITAGELSRLTDPALGILARRGVARINGLHAAALIESYGAVFPRTV